MKMKLWSAGLVAAVVLVGSMDVKAQTVKSLSRDVEALREDLEVLQRQAYRQQNSGNVAGASSDNVQQRLSQLEETVRQVSGRMDELEHKFKQVDERFKLLNQDIDVRFKLLEGKPIKGNGIGTESKGKRYEAPTAKNAPKSVVGEAVTGEDLAQIELPKKEKAKEEEKRSAQEIYQSGMDAFNAKKYDAAEQDFNLILKDYPKDKLAGNAQYWLGEVYFSREEFAKAAVAFGKGYKNYKDGNKGADSMYKLGVAMQKLDKKAEACAAYQSLPSEFPKAEKALLDKAKKAAQTLKCK